VSRGAGDVKEPLRFLASFPPIQSAIKIGDGARIQFDVPETELAAVKRLLDMRGKVLVVTVEEEDDGAQAHSYRSRAG
jgi:hypothetical protein